MCARSARSSVRVGSWNHSSRIALLNARANPAGVWARERSMAWIARARRARSARSRFSQPGGSPAEVPTYVQHLNKLRVGDLVQVRIFGKVLELVQGRFELNQRER